MRLLCGAFLTLALATAAPAPPDEGFKYSSYYPMQEGATWTYKAGDSKFTLKVTEQKKILVAGQEYVCAHVETSQDGKVVGSEDVSVQGDKIYRVASDDKPIEPPVEILRIPPPPPKAGDASKFTAVWQIHSKVEPKGGGEKQDLSGTFTEADDEKATASGTEYTAVMVKCDDLNANGAKYSFKTYYVDKIGMVRQEITAGGLTVTLELEKDGFKDGAK